MFACVAQLALMLTLLCSTLVSPCITTPASGKNPLNGSSGWVCCCLVLIIGDSITASRLPATCRCLLLLLRWNSTLLVCVGFCWSLLCLAREFVKKIRSVKSQKSQMNRASAAEAPRTSSFIFYLLFLSRLFFFFFSSASNIHLPSFSFITCY